MPILPVDAVDKSNEADSVLRHLQLIKREATAALSLDNVDVIALYLRVVRAGIKFNALADAGYPAEVLGPVLEDKLGIDWVTLEAPFLQLKNTHSVNFVTAVLTHQVEICAQHILNDTIQATPISDSTKAVLLPLITAIVDLF